MRELVRDWAYGSFNLKLYDIDRRDSLGKWVLAYEFFHDGELIFSGDDYATPQAIDSDETVAGLLGFLALKPGDTDKEYFDNYTPEQIEWRDAHADELEQIVYEFDEGDEDLPDDNADDED